MDTLSFYFIESFVAFDFHIKFKREKPTCSLCLFFTVVLQLNSIYFAHIVASVGFHVQLCHPIQLAYFLYLQFSKKSSSWCCVYFPLMKKVAINSQNQYLNNNIRCRYSSNNKHENWSSMILCNVIQKRFDEMWNTL